MSKVLVTGGAGYTRLPAPEATGNGGQVGSVQMFYTYVLKSEKDNKLYVGWTDNINRRLEEHNAGRVPSTRVRRPLQLVYYEVCLDKERAIAREKYFKTGFGRRFLNSRI